MVPENNRDKKMMSKRNAALEALGRKSIAPAELNPLSAPVSEPAAPQPRQKDAKAPSKVMLYLPPKVARKFKEMAFHEDCKAHDLYVRALEAYLRQRGHASEADLLKR
jgi:hypothetical protein